MVEHKERLEQVRERLQREELKNNASGNLRDTFNRTNNGSSNDLASSLGWKGLAVLILAITVVAIISFFIFN
ncbi:DUF6366 family protein [Salinicoccus sesuvii]|uniref:DUF6366 family protein n=1 Tax=Salinicoccus sesuvii TaxID=868281 RepID=A0ABV7N2Z6_9STAP